LQRSYRLPFPALFRNVLWTNGAKPLLLEAWGRSMIREPLREWMWKYAPGLMQKRRRRYEQQAETSAPAWLMPSDAVRLEADRRLERNREPQLPAGRKEGGFYLRMARRFIDHPLLTIEMEESFETCRRTGVPLFMPFWDRDLIDLLYRIPPDLLNRGGRSKGLVREMLARRFPALGFERQKKVLSLNFFRSRMLQEGRTAWTAVGGVPTLVELGVVDEGLLRSALSRISAGKEIQDAQLVWDVLNMEMWLRGRFSEAKEGDPNVQSSDVDYGNVPKE